MSAGLFSRRISDHCCPHAFRFLLAQLLIACDGSPRVQAQHFPQLDRASSGLQIPRGKGIAKHGRIHMLRGDPCTLVESGQQERDRVRHERLMPLREKEGF